MSHNKIRKHVIEVHKEELTTKVGQRDDGALLLKIVMKGERVKEGNDLPCDEVLNRCLGEIELLEYLL